ncbi:MAG: DUF1559 family PulG-like putative transporter [Armatimonadota bacterium]
MTYQQGPQPARRSNTGTIVAIVIGVVLFGCIFITAIMAAVLFPVFAKARETARQTQCVNNVRQLMVATQMYMQDHNNQFPDKGLVWTDISYPPKALLCPTYGIDRGNGYGYNASLSKRSINAAGMPDIWLIPVLADSRAPGNLLNTTADIDPRHAQKAVVGFADGHVEQQDPSVVTNLPLP